MMNPTGELDANVRQLITNLVTFGQDYFESPTEKSTLSLNKFFTSGDSTLTKKEKPEGIKENCELIEFKDELLKIYPPAILVTQKSISKEGQLFITKSFPLGGVLKSKGDSFELEFKAKNIPYKSISTTPTASNKVSRSLTTTIYINIYGEFKETLSDIEKKQPYIKLENGLKSNLDGLFKIDGLKEGHGLGIDNPLYEPTTPSETFFVLAGDGPKPLEEL